MLPIFDRNLELAIVLGLGFPGPFANVDSAGRAHQISTRYPSTRTKAPAPKDEGYLAGNHSDPLPTNGGKHTPGVISQGTAIIKIQAQIYTTGVDFILGNSSINP